MFFLISLMFIVGCGTDEIETFDSSDEKTTLTGIVKRGKPVKAPKRVILLQPTVDNINEVGNIMLEPTEYTGSLPTDDNGGLVDWDGDGQVDDLVFLENRCYFPKTFVEAKVLLNGTDEKIVSYQVRYPAIILGFDDVNGDGTQDVILQGGNPNRYNQGEEYSTYNVAYNVEDQYPISLEEIIASLEPTNSVNNPQWIQWDLSDYGYDAHPFHVRLNGPNLVNTQTSTYGEWGYYCKNEDLDGASLEFTNVGEDCTNVTVNL